MLKKVQKYIEQQNMISPQDKVLIGVSGGADSLALLLVLHTLYKDTDVTLEVVHVEHGIRGAESIKDADFVVDLCEKRQIICHRVSADVPGYAKENGLGTEEAARILRYEVFARLAKERGAKVALAHHKEDNAETILFQMTRGSSLAGLCGMRPIRMDENGVEYIRPFLTLHRAEIEAFLETEGQAYCTDSTNAELDYSRNYVRQNVLPALTKINTQAIGHINESAEMLSELRDFLNQEVEKNWDMYVEKTPDGWCLKMKEISQLHIALQREILYRAIAEAAGSKKDISAIHVKNLMELYENQSGRELSLPYQLVARKEYDLIWISSMQNRSEWENEKTCYLVSEEQLLNSFVDTEPCTISFGTANEELVIRVFSKQEKNMQIPTNPYTKWFDYDKIKKGFCIRTRQTGDYVISDVFGHHKNLNRYFIDEKVPAKERDRMWLLAQENMVLWVIGGRISENIKVTDETKAIIEIKYQGGKNNEC